MSLIRSSGHHHFTLASSILNIATDWQMDNSTGVKVVGSRKNKIETINRCEKRNMKCFQNIIKVLLPINNMTLSYIHRYDILRRYLIIILLQFLCPFKNFRNCMIWEFALLKLIFDQNNHQSCHNHGWCIEWISDCTIVGSNIANFHSL